MKKIIAIITLLFAIAINAHSKDKPISILLFPPSTAKHFFKDAGWQTLEQRKNLRNSRFIIEASRENILSQSESATIPLSQYSQQTDKSDSLRLAHERSQWVEAKLVALGADANNVIIRTITKKSNANWGGVVKIYEISEQ